MPGLGWPAAWPAHCLACLPGLPAAAGLPPGLPAYCLASWPALPAAWHFLGLRHLLAMIRSTSLPAKHFLGLRPLLPLIRSTKRVSKLCLGLHNLSDAHRMTVRPRRVCPSTWTGPQRLSSLSSGPAELLPNLSMSPSSISHLPAFSQSAQGLQNCCPTIPCLRLGYIHCFPANSSFPLDHTSSTPSKLLS